MLDAKKILLGVTGSIAAYKSILLARLLIKAGAEVKVVMTPAAKDFVTPLTLSTVSKNEVLIDFFAGEGWNNHVLLGAWADILVIAPLSCNTLAKMAGGLCDNLLLATYLSARCPVVVAPAMDEDMWKHPATKNNLDKIRGFGNKVIPVENGELASGLYGEGRMSEPETIVRFLEDIFATAKELSGKKMLVTAGPTHESLDPVRFISNRSSGKMGIALSEELASRGALVDLVLGPSALVAQNAAITVYPVQTAKEMLEACTDLFPAEDGAVMSAAVADYRPANVSEEKIKKTGDILELELHRTTDILKTLGANKKPHQVLIGFALESHGEKQYALDKLSAKNADMIVLNSLRDEGAGFGVDSNKVTIFEKNGVELSYDRKTKQQVAKDIVDRIVKLLHAK